MSRQSDAKSGSTSVYRQSVTPPQRANRVATRVADRIAARRRWMLACAVECACVMTASKIHLNALRAFGGRTAMRNTDSRSPVEIEAIGYLTGAVTGYEREGGSSPVIVVPVGYVRTLLAALAEQEAARRDSERYRFVRPLLGALLQSRHFEDVNDAELYLDFSRGSEDGVQLRCGTSGGYVNALVDAAIDAARQSPTTGATNE